MSYRLTASDWATRWARSADCAVVAAWHSIDVAFATSASDAIAVAAGVDGVAAVGVANEVAAVPSVAASVDVVVSTDSSFAIARAMKVH